MFGSFRNKLKASRGKVRSEAGLVMQASGSIDEWDILELPRISCPGVGICHTSIGRAGDGEAIITWS